MRCWSYRFISSVFLTVLLTFGFFRLPVATEARESERVRLPGHLLPFVQALRAADQREVAADHRLDLAVALRPRDPEGLERFLAAQREPASPDFERALTPAEFTARFAPTAEQVAAVADALTGAGLAIDQVAPNRLLINAHGNAAQVESAFALGLQTIAWQGRTAYFNTQNPAVPAGVAPLIAGIAGLESVLSFQSQWRPASVEPTNSVPYDPGEIASVYNLTPAQQAGYTGAGQTLAVATYLDYADSDLTTFWQKYNVSGGLARVQRIFVNGPSNTLDIETTLDVEWASALAPNATLLVYEGKSPNIGTALSLFSTVVNDNKASVVSHSWGLCEGDMPLSIINSLHTVFQQAQAQKQTVLVASGDNGAASCYASSGTLDLAVSYPASDSSVVAVGGTTAIPSGNSITESAWSGSGGGVSKIFSRPDYQRGAGVPAGSMRLVPDIALNADPATGYNVIAEGSTLRIGGTSVSAPVWAGIVTLINQARGGQGRLNGVVAFYDLANGAPAYPPYRDVTTGCNNQAGNGPDSQTVPNAYCAGPGWDAVTGWGSINAWNLIRDLAPLTPIVRLNTTGLSFSVKRGGPTPAAQAIAVNNGGSGTLNWSASADASWVTLSPNTGTTPGTLTVGIDPTRLGGTASAAAAPAATPSSSPSAVVPRVRLPLVMQSSPQVLSANVTVSGSGTSQTINITVTVY